MNKATRDFLDFVKSANQVAPLPPPIREEMTKSFSIKTIFTYEHTHPIILDLVCLKFFKHEWFGWLADTLIKEIELTHHTSISPNNLSKLMAVKTLHVTDSFWEEWEVFEKIIMGLNGIPVSPEILQGPDVYQLMNGVEIANKIRKETFNDEIGRYIAACLLHSDVHYSPPPLDFAQMFLSLPIYKCLICGNIGSALSPFRGHCTSCKRVFTKEKNLNFKPTGSTKNPPLEYSLTFPLEPVKSIFESIKDQESPNIKEDPDWIQASKLYIAEHFKQLKTKELKEQIDILGGYIQ